MINPDIFKAYDIRGTYPDQMNEEVARIVGAAAIEHFGVSRIAVGRDMRLSSPALFEAFKDGVTEQGAEVIDLGMVSSDELYFAVGKFGYPAGVMITASHNPKQYNGLKFCLAGAVPVSSQTGLDDIKKIALSNPPAPKPERGAVSHQDVLRDFVAEVRSFIDPAKLRPLKLAVDAGNGMAGITVPAAMQGLPITLEPLYFEPDGNFPHHPASPIEPENMVDLQKLVRDSGADIGAAFDGDADRVFIVDEKGDLVDGSAVTQLVARSLLRKNPDSTVLYNVNVSTCVPAMVEQMGGHALRTRVGHSFIKAQMRENNAIFGGEHSGHFYFRDFWFADSGLIALLTVLEVVSEENKPVSQLIRELCTRVRSGEINSHVSDTQAKENELKERYKDGALDTLDGITITYPTWWFNVRPSNTEPLLRLNVEADSGQLMEQKRDELLGVIREGQPRQS
jgi:phosphomannomutase